MSVNLTPGAPVAAKVLQYLHTRETGTQHSVCQQSTQHSPHSTVHTTQWLAYSCHSRRGSHGKLPLIGTDELAGRLEHEPQLVSVQGSGLLGSTRSVQQGHSTNTLVRVGVGGCSATNTLCVEGCEVGVVVTMPPRLAV